MNSRMLILSLVCLSFFSCMEEAGITDMSEVNDGSDSIENEGGNGNNTGENTSNSLVLNGNLELDNLFNYANQAAPPYINDDNTRSNTINNIEATIGRVLFYDKRLSSDRSVSCASCHQQEFAFGDQAIQSEGVNGLTGRHSMRLVNARFGNETNFFWDERAETLEEQTTMPIKDHGEMGFSGTEGDPEFEELIQRLSGVTDYRLMFQEAYGDTIITENRIQNSLAQFIRSIQSFDSKYDIGRSEVNNDNQNFRNFTASENRGKTLFIQPPDFQGGSGVRIGGGLGCNGCHMAPEFDIVQNSGNNGVTGVVGDPTGMDLRVTRSPSLRDIFSASGELNTPLMHTGEFLNIDQVIDHYNDIDRTSENNNLDPKLSRGGGVNLNITAQEKADLVAFLKTLTGNNVYTDEKWSNPFE